MDTYKIEPISGQSTSQQPDAGVVSTVTEKVKEAATAVGEYAGQAKEKVQEWAETAKDKTQEAAASAGEYAAHAKDKAQQWAATAADRTGEAAQDATQEMTRLIRRYPVPALCLGFALGLLLARATATRH